MPAWHVVGWPGDLYLLLQPVFNDFRQIGWSVWSYECVVKMQVYNIYILCSSYAAPIRSVHISTQAYCCSLHSARQHWPSFRIAGRTFLSAVEISSYTFTLATAKIASALWTDEDAVGHTVTKWDVTSHVIWVRVRVCLWFHRCWNFVSCWSWRGSGSSQFLTAYGLTENFVQQLIRISDSGSTDCDKIKSPIRIYIYCSLSSLYLL